MDNTFMDLGAYDATLFASPSNNEVAQIRSDLALILLELQRMRDAQEERAREQALQDIKDLRRRFAAFEQKVSNDLSKLQGSNASHQQWMTDIGRTVSQLWNSLHEEENVEDAGVEDQAGRGEAASSYASSSK